MSYRSSIAAVLSRFGGDPKQARDYCTIMALTYPHLAEEYNEHVRALDVKEEKLCQVVAS